MVSLVRLSWFYKGSHPRSIRSVTDRGVRRNAGLAAELSRAIDDTSPYQQLRNEDHSTSRFGMTRVIGWEEGDS